MGYNCKQNVWRWKKIKKGKLNGLQLTVVDSVGLGLGNSMHFKKKKKRLVYVNHFNFFMGSNFYFILLKSISIYQFYWLVFKNLWAFNISIIKGESIELRRIKVS